jgi:uncharacterized membrane protein
MILKKLLSIALLFLIFPLSSAYLTLEIYLQEDGTTRFSGESDKEFDFPEGISYENGEISGKTTLLTSKQAETWNFELSIEGLSEVYVHLPQNTRITKVLYGEVYSEKNKLLIFDSGEETIISFDYVFNEASQDNYSYYYVLLTFSLLLAIFISLKYHKKKTSVYKKPIKKRITKEKKIEIIKQTLNSRQQKIISKLQEVGKIKHSRLQKICEIPKASFSRHIQELEKKRLIRKDGEGRNKFIELN